LKANPGADQGRKKLESRESKGILDFLFGLLALEGNCNGMGRRNME